MIHYDLRCVSGHSFDGWFRGSEAFDQQARAGLLACPVCASPQVSRAIMAPRLSLGAKLQGVSTPPAETGGRHSPDEPGAGKLAAQRPGSQKPGFQKPGFQKPGSQESGAQKSGTQKSSDGQVGTTEPGEVAVAGSTAMPDRVRAVLQRIRAEVEQKCDYVGPRFAETARAMHGGDLPARPIYGETTPDQADALAEDGIEVASIPWVPRADG